MYRWVVVQGLVVGHLVVVLAILTGVAKGWMRWGSHAVVVGARIAVVVVICPIVYR